MKFVMNTLIRRRIHTQQQQNAVNMNQINEKKLMKHTRNRERERKLENYNEIKM